MNYMIKYGGNMIIFYKALIMYIIGILLGFYFGWDYCITKEINRLKELNCKLTTIWLEIEKYNK